MNYNLSIILMNSNYNSNFNNRSNSNNNRLNDSCYQLDDYGQYILNVSNTILIVYPWIMIIFGTISNVLSIIVLTRQKLRKSSTFFYLACLSAIDLCVVYTFCINFITYYHLNIDLQMKHVILCKLFAFCIYFLPQYSAWTCAAVSIDRVIGVIFTIHGQYAAAAKRWNTPMRARNITIIIGIVLFLLNVQFLFYPNEYIKQNDTIVEDVNIIYCSPENIPRYHTYYFNFWVHFDLSINVLIPFAIMIISSIIIIIRVKKTAQNLLNTRKKSSCAYNNNMLTVTSPNPNTSQIIAATSNVNKGASSSSSSKGRSSVIAMRKKSTVMPQNNSNSKARSISIMLATNNFVFISLTLPIVVFLSIAPSITDDSVCSNLKAKIRLVKIICIILMNINCTVNIFVYSLMASQFRRQLIELMYDIRNLCRNRKPDQIRLTNTNTNNNNNNNYKNNSLVNQNVNDTITVTYT